MDDDETKEILYRLDERTARIDGRMERLDKELSKFEIRVEDKIAKIEGELSDLDRRVSRNTIILNAITLGLASLVTAIATKVGGFLHFIKP